ncbi:MAG: sugar phosphate nucleotidyltransferase [Methanosarcinales archaeon]
MKNSFLEIENDRFISTFLRKMKALIIAAGRGSRLRPFTEDMPKGLIPLLGLCLLERIILSVKEVGIKDFVIVTGFKGEKIKDFLKVDSLGVRSESDYEYRIEYVDNPAWHRGNGVSVLSAEKKLKNEKKFLLLMSDHVFDSKIITKILKHEREERSESVACLLGVDKNLESIHDLEDATKVEISENGSIISIGKNLSKYNAVDCGVFLCTQQIFEALRIEINQGKEDLSSAVALLAEQGNAKTVDISGNFWMDIDTFQELKIAENKLLNSLTKPTDGVISRNINRKFSKQITRFLVKTKITPNQISFISFLIGIISAFSFQMNYNFLGGLFAQVSSIVDGVDGEIARLKFLKSNYGAYFDAILDRYADALIILSMTYSLYISSMQLWVWIVGSLALIGAPMSMLCKEKYQAITCKPYLPKYDGFLNLIPSDRDARLFIIMLGGFFNQILACLFALAIITNIKALLRFFIVKTKI